MIRKNNLKCAAGIIFSPHIKLGKIHNSSSLRGFAFPSVV